MIDFCAEDCLPLTEAAKLLPDQNGGKGLHVSTLYRWAKRGLRGPSGRCFLETLTIGGRLHCSRESLQRLFEECSGNPACGSSPRRRKRHADAEDAEILKKIQRTHRRAKKKTSVQSCTSPTGVARKRRR